MSLQANKTLIGAFVLGAIALTLTAVLILGGGRLFQERMMLVTYFDGSVKGLGRGSKVQVKGVDVGQVTDVRLLFHPRKLSFINRVLIEAEPGRVGSYADIDDEAPLREYDPDPELVIASLINRGLRAKLAMESIVTGKLLVALDFYPETPVKLRGIEPEHIELPTLPTDFEQLAKTLEQLPLEDLFYDVKEAVQGISRLVNSDDLKQAVRALNQTLQRAEQLVTRIDRQVDPLATRLDTTLADYGQLARNIDRQVEPLAYGVNDTLDEARKTIRTIELRLDEALQQATETLKSMETFTEKDSTLQRELLTTLGEVEKAARSVRQFADYLEKNPESLLRGKSRP
jgi:paraquat-inducible protein B